MQKRVNDVVQLAGNVVFSRIDTETINICQVN